MKLLVIDGNSIFNRAFYGVKLLTTKQGFYTNAIYGFLTTLNRLKNDINPDAVAIAFDVKAPTFRHKKYDLYKANRKGMPQELFMQFPVLKELLCALGYKLVEAEGFEADDILGTFAKSCTDTGNECIIATGDKDSLQLVSKDVCVRIASTKFGRPEVTLYDEDKIFETYHIKPHQLIDVKALQGDSSDNIPGVPGIGQKGALDLIQRFDNIDYIYQNIDTIDVKPAMRKKLIEGKESAYMSKFLGTIVCDAPVNTKIEDYIPASINVAETIKILSNLEMFSLIEKMGLKNVEGINETSNGCVHFNVLQGALLTEIENQIKENKQVDFLVEFEKNQPVKAAFRVKDNIFVTDFTLEFNAFLKKILEDETITKRTHDSKQIFEYADKCNIEINNLDFDTILAAYLLNASAKDYDISKLAVEYNVNNVNLINVKTEDNSIAEKTALLAGVADILSEKIIENNQEKLLKEIEIPLAKVLAQMENLGFKVDTCALKDYGDMLKQEANKLENEIYELLGEKININSPKQLGVALFETLGLPKGKKTKSGYSTSAEVLEGLINVHPVIGLILKYRTVTKLNSTYCEGMLKLVAEDGRIHSRFNQTETRTGRISSTEPNLQNIPIRTELGAQLRKFFCAEEGNILVDSDYSQIELRVLACVAEDEAMQQAFAQNVDIHTVTASQIFNIPIEMVTPLMRSKAKAVNFGIVYGISAFSLAKDINVTRKEAQTYIDNYLHHYKGIAAYMKNVVEKAKKDGFVETLFNRRRYLPELSSSNFNLRAFGQRVALNMPIQGTAADIIKIAMIKVSEKLKECKLKAKLILQVHDELIVECPLDEKDKVKEILQSEMQNAVKLGVELTADTHYGKTWYDAKG